VVQAGATEFPPDTIQSYSIQEKWAKGTLLPSAQRLSESRRAVGLTDAICK